MNIKNEKGFSLIETMVAITVLVMVITGPITLAANSLKSASVARNNFIAANLAQEGVELIRLYRTNNVIQGRSWLDDILPPGPSECVSGLGCYIDSKTVTLGKCTGVSCPVLRIDSLGMYNYSTGTNTIFIRTIHINTINADTVRVTVTINWNERFGDQSVVLEEIMHNWIQ